MVKENNREYNEGTRTLVCMYDCVNEEPRDEEMIITDGEAI